MCDSETEDGNRRGQGMSSDTIAAVATAMMGAGIGIVRISGDQAVETADQIFRKKGGGALREQESHTIHYGTIWDSGEMIDEVMVLLMRAPRSYTREDTVEIDCHGGVYVTKRILEAVIRHGARIAEPGEFTKRAFLNGRIDLSQAESVMDVIHAKNKLALNNSVRQLSGMLSKEIQEIRSVILHEIARIESALDDPEHMSLDGYSDFLQKIVSEQEQKIRRLLAGSENGRLLREGISTVIVGKPNAGKSSLLNALLGEERAIVTNIAGTTRDTLQEQMNFNGILLNVTDTAGIRRTEDAVERIGVERSKQHLADADLAIYVADASTKLDENDFEILDLLTGHKVIILLNKSDLPAVTTEEEIAAVVRARIRSEEEDWNLRILSFSAKEGEGMERLEHAVQEMFFSGEISFDQEVCITNVRHQSALSDALASIELVKQSIADAMPEDFYSIDLMNAYEKLGTIIGESVEDDLVNEIFGSFCMGK